MADGTLTFDTSIDQSGINNAGNLLKKSVSRISKQVFSAFSGSKATAGAEKKVETLAKKYDEAAKAVERQREAIAKLKREQADWKDRFESKDAQALNLYQNGRYNSAEFKETDKEAKTAYSEYERTTKAIDTASERLSAMEQKASDAKNSLNEAMNAKAPNQFTKSLKGATNGMSSFVRRVSGLAKRVFVFSVITKALRAIRSLLSGMAGQDKQLTASSARIKGNLLTAFQPLYETVLPTLKQILAVTEQVTAKLAALSAALFGKSVAQMQKNAKALNEQAKATKKVGKETEKAKRSLAGFDELNQLGSDKEDGSSDANDSSDQGVNADFSGKISELTPEQEKIATYGLLLAGTGLLLVGIATLNPGMIITGALLIKSGLDLGQAQGVFAANPPWVNQVIAWGLILCGLGLMILGALSKPIPNVKLILMGAAMMAIGISYGKASGAFDSMPTWLKQVITWGSILVGFGLIIAGCIGSFNPAMIIAGIGLMGLGIAFGASTGSFDVALKALSDFGESVKEWIGEKWQKLKDWWKNNVSPIFTKEWWDEKWQHIKESAKEKVQNIKDDVVGKWTEIKTKIENVMTSIKDAFVNAWQNIKDFTKDTINSILTGIESFINGFIRGINKMVQAINAIHVDIPEWVPEYGGKRIGFNLKTVQEISIPRLATGTVVPANYGEYMAVLGDNKREPEVVSPISTIKQAVVEAIAQVNGSGNGQPMTVIINLDGSVIGKAAMKYQAGRKIQVGAKV